MSGKQPFVICSPFINRIPGALLLPATLKILSATTSPTRKTRPNPVVYLQEIHFSLQAVVASSRASDQK